ncbi:MAG TPA: response regulator [Bryobacteraceae bacterium]|nr:response regulator [Bryobacteraceae bacterium]
MTDEPAVSRVRDGQQPGGWILLVEDNPGDVRLMREALSHDGADKVLQVVEDGEQAVSYLRQVGKYRDAPRPVLIFLDLNLPRKDGREVLREIKADSALRRIPVVVLTTSESQVDVHKAYDLHANCYVRKPNDLDEYLRVIRACEVFWLQTVRLPR